MRRKVIQIADSTQLISLPRKWALKFGIKKGDELEVEEIGNSISIRTDKDVSLSRVDINLKGNEQLIHRALSSLYRGGYDEIKITFEKPSELEIIQNTVNQELIGFEIVEQGREYLIIKQVSNINQSEFEVMLRRTFNFLISTADECLDALKANDINILRNFVLRDITINKLTDYCRRALNKKEGYFKHTGPGYTIIELLEKVGDGYRDLCKYLSSQNKIKINKSIIEILSEINLLLKESYRLFYNFNLIEMGKFLVKREDIESKIVNLSKSLSKQESPVAIYLNNIVKDIFYLNGPLMINGL